jgi:fumarylacetoacetase
MTKNLNSTHDLSLRSWVSSANAEGCDFPIQNLPHGVFRRAGSNEAFRGGVAIGEQIVDLTAVIGTGLFTEGTRSIAQAAAKAPLNEFMGLSSRQRSALRSELSALLADSAPADTQQALAACLVPQAQAEYQVASRVENFTDYYSSLNHATNVGALFRPDNPILPNYRWLPVGYTGRVSSVRVSGENFHRPWGQLKDPSRDAPEYAPCKRLDYEVELGFIVGEGNALGSRINVADADQHLFGICLLNDWSARDIQSWEYQPLGPFLSKSFFSSLSPWVVTMEALEPFRTGFARPEGDHLPLPHLHCDALAERGSIDIRIQMSLQTPAMRSAGQPAVQISDSRFTDAYWAMSQLVAHQTSNGSNLCPGDLLGSGTLSGPEVSSRACLLELTEGGKKPLTLPNGETRTFLQDGDTTIMTAYCVAPGFQRIGFGECRTTVLEALPL